MKGGALPSLSSRDRFPGLTVATPGLCYVPHKSSSCFTNALPHLGAGLICQAELPGKFFCSVNRHCYKLSSCLLVLYRSFPPHFSRGLPRSPLMPLTVGAEARCHGEFILCYCICHCFHCCVDLPCVLARTSLPQFCNSEQKKQTSSPLLFV